MGMGNEAMGTVFFNDVLWSLALLLLAMSLVFIMIIHLIGHKGGRSVANFDMSAHVRRITGAGDRIATGVHR